MRASGAHILRYILWLYVWQYFLKKIEKKFVPLPDINYFFSSECDFRFYAEYLILS